MMKEGCKEAPSVVAQCEKCSTKGEQLDIHYGTCALNNWDFANPKLVP